MRVTRLTLLSMMFLGAVIALGAGEKQVTPDSAALWEEATLYFQPLPAVAANPDNALTESKVELGRSVQVRPAVTFEEASARRGLLAASHSRGMPDRYARLSKMAIHASAIPTICPPSEISSPVLPLG